MQGMAFGNQPIRAFSMIDPTAPQEKSGRLIKYPLSCHRDPSAEQGVSQMRTILLTSVVALGLSTGAALAETLLDDNIPTDAKPAPRPQAAPRFGSVGTVAPARGRYVTPSWSNPTGQVVRGLNCAISAYAPMDNGSASTVDPPTERTRSVTRPKETTMPFVNITQIAGTFASDEKHEMATALSDVMVEFEGSVDFCDMV
jgi:hypothetical protein